MATNIRKPFTRVRVKTTFTGSSATKQSFKDECDINHIMKRYNKTGLADHFARYQGKYDDVTGGLDYHQAMNAVVSAQESFELLPALVRKRFNNDPGLFLEFACNPDNLDEMRKMGLAKAQPVPPAASPPAEPVVPAGGEVQ